MLEIVTLIKQIKVFSGVLFSEPDDFIGDLSLLFWVISPAPTACRKMKFYRFSNDIAN